MSFRDWWARTSIRYLKLFLSVTVVWAGIDYALSWLSRAEFNVEYYLWLFVCLPMVAFVLPLLISVIAMLFHYGSALGRGDSDRRD